MKQNNSTELLAYSFNYIYSNNDPPDPLDPNSAIFLDFMGCLLKVGLFSALGTPGTKHSCESAKHSSELPACGAHNQQTISKQTSN